MSAKRWVATGVLAAGLGVGTYTARAEDPAPPKKSDAPEAPKEATKKKDPFFGDRFAMYLETRGGPASIDTIHNGVGTTAQFYSDNEIKLTDNKSGQFSVGWTLPRGRGQYLLTYSGIADGDYELNASGDQKAYLSTVLPPPAIDTPVPWWTVQVRHGLLSSTQAAPFWRAPTTNDPGDDTNGNGKPDPGEFQYPVTSVSLIGIPVPKDLGTRIQTWDLAYRREFGGVRIRARWAAGLRYLTVDGALVTPSWLKGVQDDPTFGYSDGAVNHFILMNQSTTGIGPAGSGEVQFNFFRQRLVLYAKGEAAFVSETLKADSGSFTYFAHDTSQTNGSPYYPGEGRIEDTVSKTTWNLAFELGVRVKLLEGFNLIVDWNRTGYLDTILIPTTISIPQNASQISLGTTALFVSRDLVVSTLNLGLSFQF